MSGGLLSFIEDSILCLHLRHSTPSAERGSVQSAALCPVLQVLEQLHKRYKMRYTYCLQFRHAKRSGRTLGQSRTRWPTMILSAGYNHALIQKNHPFVAIHTLYRHTFNFSSFLCAGPRCMAKFYVSLANIIMIHKAFRISTS